MKRNNKIFFLEKLNETLPFLRLFKASDSVRLKWQSANYSNWSHSLCDCEHFMKSLMKIFFYFNTNTFTIIDTEQMAPMRWNVVREERKSVSTCSFYKSALSLCALCHLSLLFFFFSSTAIEFREWEYERNYRMCLHVCFCFCVKESLFSSHSRDCAWYTVYFYEK